MPLNYLTTLTFRGKFIDIQFCYARSTAEAHAKARKYIKDEYKYEIGSMIIASFPDYPSVEDWPHLDRFNELMESDAFTRLGDLTDNRIDEFVRSII